MKVQFHWDRKGQRNEHSSCWLRVSQSTAGPAWGAVFLLRVGHEVIVEFLEGNPARPIVRARFIMASVAHPITYRVKSPKTLSITKMVAVAGDSSETVGDTRKLKAKKVV